MSEVGGWGGRSATRGPRVTQQLPQPIHQDQWREGGRGGNSLHLLPAVWSRMWVVQIWVLLDMNEAKPMAQLIWKSEYRQKYSTAKNNKYSISFSSAAVYLFEEESASEVSCAAIYCKVMYKYSWVFRGVHFSFFVLTENSDFFRDSFVLFPQNVKLK